MYTVRATGGAYFGEFESEEMAQKELSSLGFVKLEGWRIIWYQPDYPLAFVLVIFLFRGRATRPIRNIKV